MIKVLVGWMQDFEEFGVVFTGSGFEGGGLGQESGQPQAISEGSGPSLQGLRLRVPGSASQWWDEGRSASGCKVNVESPPWRKSEWVLKEDLPGRAYLDSAATHSSRMARNGEMRNARRVPVKLASGEKEAHLSHGTVLFKEEVEPLVSLGRVVRLLDCKVRWDSDAFVLEYPQRGVLPVMVERDVPVIAKSLALELINELEEREREEHKTLQSLEPPRLYSSRVKEEEPAESEAEPGVPQAAAPPPGQPWNRARRKRLPRRRRRRRKVPPQKKNRQIMKGTPQRSLTGARGRG